MQLFFSLKLLVQATRIKVTKSLHLSLVGYSRIFKNKLKKNQIRKMNVKLKNKIKARNADCKSRWATQPHTEMLSFTLRTVSILMP